MCGMVQAVFSACIKTAQNTDAKMQRFTIAFFQPFCSQPCTTSLGHNLKQRQLN
jgi:hypothetical protein